MDKSTRPGRDNWETISPHGPEPGLDDMDLLQVLKRGESKAEKERPDDQISFRSAPVGFRGLTRHIAEERQMSYSQLSRLALKHGAAILATDPRMGRVRDAYAVVVESAMDLGDPFSLTRLDEPHPYEFLHSMPVRTTLSCIHTVTGQLSELAHFCGIPQPKIAVIAIYLSLLTLPNERGYRDTISKEVKAFWKAMRRRQKYLEVEDRGQ